MMEWLQQNAWIFWGLVAIVSLLVEAMTTALVSVWFVPAALLAALVSVFCDTFWVQCLVFVVLSVIFMVLFRFLYKKFGRHDKKPIAADPMCGKNGTVIEAISATGGKVEVGDVYWKALSADGVPLEVGTPVTVIAADGTTLTVTPRVSSAASLT